MMCILISNNYVYSYLYVFSLLTFLSITLSHISNGITFMLLTLPPFLINCIILNPRLAPSGKADDPNLNDPAYTHGFL